MNSKAPLGSKRARRRRASAGFSLAEVLIVLAVISVLAAVATPGFVSMMRDRRTAQDTGTFVDAFRVARSRALARGAAVRAAIITGATPTIVLQEHISDPDLDGNADDPTSQPVPSCTAGGIWRTIDVFRSRGNTTDLRAFSHLTAAQVTGTAGDEVMVCYTPRGRTMVDYPGGVVTFVSLDGVLRMTTERAAAEGTSDGKVREIFVLPNGLTRMAL